jgi:hypothetical protein
MTVHLRRGVVRSLDPERSGAVELSVEVEGQERPAIAYPDLTGDVAEGDTVILNTTATDLALGTGGWDFVVAVEGTTTGKADLAGRVMKARYTPLQTAVATVEETDPGGATGTLDGMPVIAAPLHSMIAAAAAGARVAGAERIAYVMTDGAALPGGFSRLVPRLRGAGLLDAFVTTGQAFGGDLESVTIWSGLLAARNVAAADVAIVADGPGNLGTDTMWGVSALGNGNALNAAATLAGRPVAALRISFADERERHRGLSHHSRTILQHVAGPGVNIAVPALANDAQRDAVWEALRGARLEERHQLVEVEGAPALAELERLGVQVDSMGRSVDEDPAFFLAGGAAGILAARMAAGSKAWERDAEG